MAFICLINSVATGMLSACVVVCLLVSGHLECEICDFAIRSPYDRNTRFCSFCLIALRLWCQCTRIFPATPYTCYHELCTWISCGPGISALTCIGGCAGELLVSLVTLVEHQQRWNRRCTDDGQTIIVLNPNVCFNCILLGFFTLFDVSFWCSHQLETQRIQTLLWRRKKNCYFSDAWIRLQTWVSWGWSSLFRSHHSNENEINTTNEIN